MQSRHLTFDDLAGQMPKDDAVIYTDFDPDDMAQIAEFLKLARTMEDRSDHHTYKVGCVAFGRHEDGRTFWLATANTIPQALKAAGYSADNPNIGDGHATIHAEMNAIERLPPFASVSFAVSRPPCPTCLQAMSELHTFMPDKGCVKRIVFDKRVLEANSVMDAKSINKWNKARDIVWDTAKYGGLALMMLDPLTLQKRTWPPAAPPQSRTTIKCVPLAAVKTLADIDMAALMNTVTEYAQEVSGLGHDKASMVVGKDAGGAWNAILASAGLPPGFDENRAHSFRSREGRIGKSSYRYIMSATKRAMIAAIKLGISLEGGALLSTSPPRSGMLVNAIGYGLKTLILPEIYKPQIESLLAHQAGGRDIPEGVDDPDLWAVSQCLRAGVIHYNVVPQ